MTNHPAQPANQSDSFDQRGLDDQRRELELELIKVRSEAKAARLEARAAELELTIRRMSRSLPSAPAPGIQAESADSITPAAPHFSTSAQALHPEPVQPAVSPPSANAGAFASWDAVRSAASVAASSQSNSDQTDDASTVLAIGRPLDNQLGEVEQTDKFAPQDDVVQRVDAAAAAVPRPRLLDQQELPVDSAAEPSMEAPAGQVEVPAVEDSIDESDATEETASAGATVFATIRPLAESRPEPADVEPTEVAVDADQESEEQRRRSPTALLISTLAHVIVLLLLGALTLSHREPKDQVAISASVSNPSEVPMETFEIESSEPESEPTEPPPSESEYELSPLGEMKVADFAPDAPPAPPSPTADAMLDAAQMSAASMALKSDSEAKIQFCGVEGGGNHFVYLVDSSRSMRDGFESARAELLHSIDVLKPDQRFYVIFFDAEPDYMRLSDPNTDEPRSADATPENKQALKRWAMRISKDDGRAPYDPLRFALQLRPDVIFLLSDGEFPQGIEDLLKAENRVENLFGDSGPVSIVHTIGYHSREGESRMRRIAEQNQGQYRHVPKP